VAGLTPEARFELRLLQQNERPGAIPAFFISCAVAVRYAVIVREGGRSSTPRRLGCIADVGDYWMPAFAGMTS
jgi:hypothetical protein